MHAIPAIPAIPAVQREQVCVQSETIYTPCPLYPLYPPYPLLRESLCHLFLDTGAHASATSRRVYRAWRVWILCENRSNRVLKINTLVLPNPFRFHFHNLPRLFPANILNHTCIFQAEMASFSSSSSPSSFFFSLHSL